MTSNRYWLLWAWMNHKMDCNTVPMRRLQDAMLCSSLLNIFPVGLKNRLQHIMNVLNRYSAKKKLLHFKKHIQHITLFYNVKYLQNGSRNFCRERSYISDRYLKRKKWDQVEYWSKKKYNSGQHFFSLYDYQFQDRKLFNYNKYLDNKNIAFSSISKTISYIDDIDIIVDQCRFWKIILITTLMSISSISTSM